MTDCGAVDVELPKVMQYLRMGGATPDGALAERIAALRERAGREMFPRRTWLRVRAPQRWLDESRALSLRLSGCRDVYLACGTLGAAYDAFHRRVSVRSCADALIVQAIGAAAVEKVMDSIEDDIRAELSAGETLAARYSQGYADFPLSEQRALLGMLDASRKVGVSLTGDFLMVPSKSVSAVIGVRDMVDTRRGVLI